MTTTPLKPMPEVAAMRDAGRALRNHVELMRSVGETPRPGQYMRCAALLEAAADAEEYRQRLQPPDPKPATETAADRFADAEKRLLDAWGEWQRAIAGEPRDAAYRADVAQRDAILLLLQHAHAPVFVPDDAKLLEARAKLATTWIGTHPDWDKAVVATLVAIIDHLTGPRP